MLTPWSLSYRSTRKQIAWWVYQRQKLQGVTVFHATSEKEAEDIRRLGFDQPIAVIPNAVDMSAKQLLIDGQPLKSSEDKKVILFLSRIHPKKGLLMLIEALSQLRLQDWRLVIAGPDEIGHQLEVKSLVNRYKLNDDVTFIGSVDNDNKWDIYRQADLFILPSFSENFGIVIAEALAAGLPVITTNATPWQQLQEYHCGWWIEPNVDTLTSAIQEATSLDSESRLEMGKNGQRLIREHYSWDNVAEQMASVYRWIIGSGGKPPCIM